MSAARISRVRMRNGGADVRVLHTPQPEPARDIARMMREAAAGLEAGAGSDVAVENVIALMEHADGDVTVYGWGEETDLVRTLGMLHCAIHKLTRMRLAPFEDPSVIGIEL